MVLRQDPRSGKLVQPNAVVRIAAIVPQPPSEVPDAEPVAGRILLERFGGPVHRTAVAGTETELLELLELLGLDRGAIGDVDLSTELVAFFGVARSSGCEYLPVSRLERSSSFGHIHPVLELDPEKDQNCLSTGPAHGVLATLTIEPLRGQPTTLWVYPTSPACCPDGVTHIDVL